LFNCSQVSNFKSKITDLGAISISFGAEIVMNETEFWNRVKGLLKKRNTTQREFTRACGIAYGTFCGWIYRNIYPTIFEGYVIARVLGVSVEYLMSGRDKQSKKTGARIEKVQTLLCHTNETLERII
jgi:transcriptional regulator with XRE-family HTH domain